jgi:putative molybdopterin biosynthesis protein
MAEPERRRYLRKTSLSEAIRIALELVPSPLAAETVPTEQALGRVTAAPVFARRSSPHYHGAAMDGIAVRAEDTFGASEVRPIRLRRAQPEEAAPAGAYVPVDTGSPLPPWADAVVMIERVYPGEDAAAAAAGMVVVRDAAAPWQHVRLVGEDVVATEALLPRGHRLRAYDVGALLAAGVLEVAVHRRPRIAIIPTGGEVVEPDREPGPGQITEYNSRMMAGFVAEWGAVAERRPAIPDLQAAIEEGIRAAAAGADVVAVIAGSSAGLHDFTAGAVSALGELLVHGIEVMPGKPAIVGRASTTPVLGIPGYPVSAVIICQQLLRPMVARLLGTRPDAPPTVRALVPRNIPSRLGLEEFVRVSLGVVDDRVVLNPLARGAGAITTMVRADGFLRIPANSEGVSAGEEATVELLRPLEDVRHTILFTGSHDLTIGVLEDTLKARWPELKISATNVGSLGGLVALRRREAHLAGSHLLDPRTGTYNLPDIRRHLDPRDILVINLVRREQGLIVQRGNPQGLRGLEDLARPGIRYVNRQPGAGTRVLLDYRLRRLGIRPERIAGYEREEHTHMAVAVAVASGLADAGLGIRQAAAALGLDFLPLEVEDYDLVLLRTFAASEMGERLLAAVRSAEFAAAVARLAGYSTERTGTEKPLAPAARGRRTAPPRAGRAAMRTATRGRRR